mmetsp:Transcript_32744/g.82156  ORF Transcript_32744/g.82156 Transcript_32744/m.82156 type:complete len:119 (-) Transcript_32744:71-427(-)
MLMGSSFAHASSTITPTPTFLSAYIVYMSAPYAPPVVTAAPIVRLSALCSASTNPPSDHFFFCPSVLFFYIYFAVCVCSTSFFFALGKKKAAQMVISFCSLSRREPSFVFSLRYRSYY